MNVYWILFYHFDFQCVLFSRRFFWTIQHFGTFRNWCRSNFILVFLNFAVWTSNTVYNKLQMSQLIHQKHQFFWDHPNLIPCTINTGKHLQRGLLILTISFTTDVLHNFSSNFLWTTSGIYYTYLGIKILTHC